MNEEFYRKIFYFALKKDFARDNPGVVKRFIKAIDRANTFLRENEGESQTIVAEALNLDKEAVVRGWKEGKFTLFLDQALIVSLEDQARWAIKNKLTDATKVPNYLNYIYFDALEAVKPKSMTIIREEDTHEN